MAQISATASNGHHTFTLDVNETYVSGSADNYSDVSFALTLLPNYYDWYDWASAPVSYTIKINGTTYTGDIWSYTAGTTLTIRTGTQRIPHNDNGSKTLNFSFTITSNYSASFLPGSAAASGSMALTAIVRAPTLLNTLVSRTESSLTVKWSANMSVDKLLWSSDGGTTFTEITLSAAATSGTYTITSLTADTAYSVVTRARGTTSQIYGNSPATSFSTYSYPYANSTPDFKIGSDVKIGLFNPLGRSVTVELLASDGSSGGTLSTSGTSVEGFSSAASVLYASIPNAASATYSVKVTYLTNVKTVSGGTYSADPALASPQIGSVTYLDQRGTVTYVTEDDQLIVQGESLVQVTASGLTGRNGASITAADVTVEGVTYSMTITGNVAKKGVGRIASAANVTATVTVTDSRGLTSTSSVTLTVIPYSEPSAIYSVTRKSNFYTETDVVVNPSVSDISGNNHATIYLSYKKETDATYSAEEIITSPHVANLDNFYAWNVKIRVADYFESTEYDAFVAVGIPAVFFDRIKKAIGIFCFPKHEKSVECDGHDIRKSVVTLSLSANITSPVSGSYQQINLDASNSFGDLISVQSAGVRIGDDVSKVLVSGRLTVSTSSAAAYRYVRICKNSYSAANTLDWNARMMSGGVYESIELNPVLVDVSPGDVIYIYYYVENGDVVVGDTAGRRTSLTVEYVG